MHPMNDITVILTMLKLILSLFIIGLSQTAQSTLPYVIEGNNVLGESSIGDGSMCETSEVSSRLINKLTREYIRNIIEVSLAAGVVDALSSLVILGVFWKNIDQTLQSYISNMVWLLFFSIIVHCPVNALEGVLMGIGVSKS